MLELSMHILDIAQNSLAAGSTRVDIRIHEDLLDDLLTIEIQDNGWGISEDVLTKVMDPFYTSRTTRGVGLGLSLLKEATELCQGHLQIRSVEGQGTVVIARFRLDHFDRAPLGDMGETMGILIAGNPKVEFLYEHRVNDQTYILETWEMRKILGAIDLDDPLVIDFVRQDISLGLKVIGAATFPKTMEVLR